MNDQTFALNFGDVPPATLAIRLVDESAADIVEILNRLPPEAAAEVLGYLPIDRAVEVVDTPGLDNGPEMLGAYRGDQRPALLAGLSADRLADLLRLAEPDLRADLLAGLDADLAQSMRRLLSYGEETVGAIMTTEFVGVPADWTVAETLHHVRQVERSRETVYAIFAQDRATGRLVSVVTLRRLISADPAASVLTAARPGRAVTVRVDARRDEAARKISKYDLLAVPVVDETQRVIGIVTVDDVIDDMIARQTEEVQRFGGVEALDEPYMQSDFWSMIRKRAGWLCVLFLSEMLTATAMQGFEGELEKALVLTLFIPLIMSSGGNSGSQATSLIIRALALKQLKLGDWWRVALREIPSGLVLGSILGLIGILRIAAWQTAGLYDYGLHWPLVALTVGAALVGIVTFGSLSGSMLPFVLQRLGFDPATASAPFVATLVDVSGLVIYFTVASIILHGTLL